MNDIFNKRCTDYFKDRKEEFLELLKQPVRQSFFLNTRKGVREELLQELDFAYETCDLSDMSFYHDCGNIGKTMAYELGLIYPQEIAASLTSDGIDPQGIKLVADLCAAPGGKTINILNRLPEDVLCISNDMNHTRSLILAQNLERLGLDKVIITNKDCNVLAQQLKGCCDLVILDAPCSGEGIIRKYPRILEEYSVKRIEDLAKLQSELLENAYGMLKRKGKLLYSTCTYAPEEDEWQIQAFLERHPDMKLLPAKMQGCSRLEGTAKLSPLNGTEGQFFAMLEKQTETESVRLKEMACCQDPLLTSFIRENLDLDDYRIYSCKDHFYLSLQPLIDLQKNVLRYGIPLGEIRNKRFEPDHALYRSCTLKDRYRHVYEMNDEEYRLFVSGNVICRDLEDAFYLMTYHGFACGFSRCSKGVLKNKYPKGLRRML